MGPCTPKMGPWKHYIMQCIPIYHGILVIPDPEMCRYLWDLGDSRLWDLGPWEPRILKCIPDVGHWEPWILKYILNAGPWETRILKGILDAGP